MADLASGNLTITIQKEYRGVGHRRNVVKIAFGDAALTVPSGGVPLPAAASFGLTSSLDYLVILDQDDATGIVWKYDYENKKLRQYVQGTVVSAAGAATMDDFAQDTSADPYATAVSLSLTNSTGAGTKIFGKLKEVLTAPPATVLYAEAVGF